MKISLENDNLVIRISGPEELHVVRSIPARRYDGTRQVWVAPHIYENWAYCLMMGMPVKGLPEPTSTGYNIGTTQRNMLAVKVPQTRENIEKCRRLPEYKTWNQTHEAWICRPTLANIQYLQSVFPQATWSDKAKEYLNSVNEAVAEFEEMREAKYGQDLEVTDFKFKTKPFQHQMKAFALSRDREHFAFFMEQGTGKTKVAIDTAAYLATRNKIQAALVICPNSVKTNWAEDELPTHMPEYISYRALVWKSGLNKEERQELDVILHSRPQEMPWLVMNFDAFSTKKGVEVAERFLSKYNAICIVDESSKIKNPRAKRTKSILKLKKLARYRRIMSGTPVTQSPLDIYSQFKFLDENILGFGSYYTFQNHYAIIGGWQNKQVIGYAHLDELAQKVDPHSYRVLKVDCLDLPEKIYEKRTVELSSEQKRLYKQMRDEMIAEFADGTEVSAAIALTKLLRLHQITGGFLPDELGTIRPIPGPNPKIEALLEILEETQGKAIIWSRFRDEIALISKALRDEYGADSVVEFHGGVTETQRTTNRKLFQDPNSPVRWFVGQQQTGGVGLTLTAASTVIYYSNTFSLEDRLQSEDRAHRIGQKNHVTYIDIMAKGTIDSKLIRALRAKKDLADQITGDQVLQWI